MIRLGTSGFSYDDWVGPVYPPDLTRGGWLAHYASEFDTVELNVTYYRVPKVSIVQGWAKRTPDNFLFTVKAHRGLTHERVEPSFEQFVASLGPLREAGKLACVLAQFPYSFHPTERNYAYLRILKAGLAELPVVVEFRDRAWVQERTFDLLAELDLGYCCVDEPRLRGLMPPIVRASSEIGYVRFHGRNAAKWWKHDQAWERYDYTYTEEELEEWLPGLHELNRTVPIVLVYANNHYRGQSIDTIKKLKKLLSTQAG